MSIVFGGLEERHHLIQGVPIYIYIYIYTII